MNLGVMQPSDVTVEGSAAPFSPWDASTVSAATQPSHVQGSPLPVRPLPVPVPFRNLAGSAPVDTQTGAGSLMTAAAIAVKTEPEEEDMGELDIGLDKNCTSYLILSPKQLKRYLTACEPVAFSAANLKTMVRRNGRDVTRDDLLKIIEFITKRDSLTNITKEQRAPGVLQLDIVAQSNRLGRRGRDLVLPPDLVLYGCYLLKLVGTDIVLV